MDALAVFMILAMAMFGTEWLDWMTNYLLLPMLAVIIAYRLWMLARGVPWCEH